jgi:mono/diheme cytochrome c family protein
MSRRAMTRARSALVAVFATAACAATATDVAVAADAARPASAWSVFAPPAGAVPGRAVFWNYCEACHGEGAGKPGTAALAAKYGGAKPALLEQRTDLTPEVVRRFVRNGVSIMPIFRKTELGEADLELLVSYLAQR